MATPTSTQQSEPPSQSPSPPPLHPPTPLTPGPRAAAFIQLYNSALGSTLKAVGYESFKACFPGIGERAEVQLRGLLSGMVGRLGGFAKDEFEIILKERNVVENLNRLEDLIADAKKRKARSTDEEGDLEVIPHLLPPKPLLKSHLQPLYNQQQSTLNAKLQTTQSQNATLMREIEEQRREIEELLRMGEKLVGDLEGAGGRLGGRGDVFGEGAASGEKALGEMVE